MPRRGGEWAHVLRELQESNLIVIKPPHAKVARCRSVLTLLLPAVAASDGPAADPSATPRRGDAQPRAVSVEPEALVRGPALRFVPSPVPAGARLSRRARARHPLRRDDRARRRGEGVHVRGSRQGRAVLVAHRVGRGRCLPVDRGRCRRRAAESRHRRHGAQRDGSAESRRRLAQPSSASALVVQQRHVHGAWRPRDSALRASDAEG